MRTLRRRTTGLVAAAASVLLWLLPTAGNAKAQSDRPPTGASDSLDWQATSCPGQTSPSPGGQYPDGRVVVCVRVPDVPGGTYHLAWTGYLSQLLGKTTPTTLPAASGGASPAVLLSATPRSVTPGQRVTLTGTLRRPQRVNESPLVSFCWGGCPGGLHYSVPAQWLSAGTFRASITAPAAPWAETAPDRVSSPVPGDYVIGVQCVELTRACGLGRAEGEAVVHLRSAAAYTCRSVPGCARLGVSPAVASPGGVVRLTGYAPLTATSTQGEQLIGGFVEGERGGNLSAAVRFSNRAQGSLTVEVSAGDAALRVAPAPTWANLGRLKPLGQVAGEEQPISSNPADPSLVAWCANGSVELEGPGGTTEVPTKAATAVLLADRALPSIARQQFRPGCATVAVEGGAVFVGYAYGPELGAPPVDNVALYSTDTGRSWSLVPAPPGLSPSAFGGFRYGPAGAVDAVFARPARAPGKVDAPEIEQYSSATGSWAASPFACPVAGPCVTWGATTVPDCGMDMSITQVVLSSDDGGHWASPPGDLGFAETCWSATIVALSPGSALVLAVDDAINASGLYPALLATDGGRRWQQVSLPALPGQVPGAQESLFALPDGAIVSTSTQPWDLLEPAANHWCTVGAVPAQPKGTFAIPSSYAVIGSSLWWLVSGLSSGSSVRAYSLADSDLACRG